MALSPVLSANKPLSTAYSKTAALLDYNGNISARDVFTSVRALLFRDAVAPYSHPRLAWGDVEGEHTFWMARAHKYLLMPQRDLTVGGRAPVTHLLRPARLPAPRYGSDHLRGQRGLLLPGFQRDAPVAGYNYSSDWTPLLTGLSPARMAASLAAPTPSS